MCGRRTDHPPYEPWDNLPERPDDRFRVEPRLDGFYYVIDTWSNTRVDGPYASLTGAMARVDWLNNTLLH